MNQNKLQIKNLSVVYPNGYRALDNVSLNISNGVICGIIGPNGAGKTSFIKGLLGLVPTKGEVLFHGKEIKKNASKTAYVQQKQNIDMDFPISVFQCVLMGTYARLGLFRKPGKTEKDKTLKAIETVGLSDFKDNQIRELSGGQFQRVLFARALVQHAELILLDEPFVGIDVNSESIIINELKKLAKEGKTILIVHHDLSKLHSYFDELVFINKTLIASGKIEDVLIKENMKKTFEVFNNPLFI